MAEQNNPPTEINNTKSSRKKKVYLILAGLILGGAGGFLYYFFIGCRTGSCAITSNPWLSILWGAALGYLVFDMIPNKTKTVPKTGDGSN